MSTIVVMPGGFHPFHAGHASLYQSALEAFPGAEVYVAATNDTKTRPFPFAIKEKLAKVAGVKPGHFVQVKSPFQAKEITQHYDPEQDVLIFVRSEKDKNEQPKPGGVKKDGTPSYFQPWTGKDLQPFGKQAYIAYLPTVEFGPGITSATEIRNAWPTLNDKRKTAMVMSLYPATQKNPKLAANVVKMLDLGMGNELDETIKRVEPISKSVPIQQTVIHPVKQDVYVTPEKKTTPAVVNHIKPREVKEFAPPSSDDGGGDNRSRRIRKLLEIAIQVAKEKNIDELGMIHGMNMIAGDEFFNTAVEGILPDITDKEYMFVLQSAYKTVKQGLAEAKKKRKNKSRKRSLGRYFFPGYGYYGGSGESGEGGGDGGGEGMAEGVPKPGPSSGAPKQFGADAQIQNRQMTVKDIISSIPGVPYYNNVVDDWDAKDYSWGVTKKVIEYATYLKDHPESLAKLPPAIVLNGKFEDGAHRVSAIWLLQQRMDPKNPLWKNAKLNVQFVKQGVAEGTGLSVEQLAHISDKALDDAYHYGRSTPGANFGWLANMQSAKAAKRLIDAGVTDIEAISDAIHKGWNVTAAADYKGQLQLDTPTPDEKKLKRAKLAMQSYSQLPEEEKEKDRVVARVLLQAIKGDSLTEFAPPGSDDREPDEEEILRQLAAQWWNGTEQQMKKAQQTLEAMGWEIGQDESGDDDAGVFVIRAGDENGDSYIAFHHSELSLDEGLGIPYPGTYEQDNEMTTTKGGQMRTLAIANEGNLSESLDYLEEK